MALPNPHRLMRMSVGSAQAESSSQAGPSTPARASRAFSMPYSGLKMKTKIAAEAADGRMEGT